MAYVTIPKDLSRIESKVLFGLTTVSYTHLAIPLPSRLPGKIPYFWVFLLYNNQNNRKIKEKYK